MWPFRSKRGTAPDGFRTIVLSPNPNVQYFYQEKQVYPWPNVPAHETRAALTNCWQGNQLPGPVNFIPGVAKSKFTWNVPTSYMNTLKNQQYNRGFNIQSYSSVQSASLMAQVQQLWANRGR